MTKGMDWNEIKFDEEEVESEHQELAAEILAVWNRVAKDRYKLGELLLAAKEKISRGSFQSWVKENFPFSYSTANSYMNVAKNIGSPEDAGLFGVRALYLLASPQCSDELRKTVLESAREGKRWEEKDLRDRLAKECGGSTAKQVQGDSKECVEFVKPAACGRKPALPLEEISAAVNSLYSLLFDLEWPKTISRYEENRLSRFRQRITAAANLLR